MYKGLAIIFGFLFLGEIVENLGVPVPGSVLGMLFLTFALITGIVKVKDVEKEGEFLVRNMSVMFIPPGVGIILYLNLLRQNLIPITVALVLSFLITLFITGKTVEVLRK
ncbi:CidA/LrgA family protein [Pyrococcus sp. ST04]|uniref:CidA/LrgA family protein n=1 Tax=Pyrococcus sp. ST04 TaxID=1183377 RepID=UPI0002605F4E|nr:CidA/LrgA family protein [Pyrococcus sp. ST04]AFK23294.1 putative Murein hydrolase exporter lrgA-like protein (lrgA) [Pyrococcus sp. ST04]